MTIMCPFHSKLVTKLTSCVFTLLYICAFPLVVLHPNHMEVKLMCNHQLKHVVVTRICCWVRLTNLEHIVLCNRSSKVNKHACFIPWNSYNTLDSKRCETPSVNMIIPKNSHLLFEECHAFRDGCLLIYYTPPLPVVQLGQLQVKNCISIDIFTRKISVAFL